MQGAKSISKAETIAAILLLVSIGFGWMWATLALQVIVPLAMVAIVARRPDLFSFAMINRGGASGPPCWLGCTYITNAFVLYAWFHCVQKIGWARLIELPVAAGLVLFSASIFADVSMRRRRNWAGMVVLFLFNAFYGYIAIFELNILLDHSPDFTEQSVIADKRYIYGKGGGFELDIRPWGPIKRVSRVWVSAPVYASVQTGGPACMVLRQGALGVPWYTAQGCPWNGGRVLLGDFFTSP